MEKLKDAESLSFVRSNNRIKKLFVTKMATEREEEIWESDEDASFFGPGDDCERRTNSVVNSLWVTKKRK